jgi:hypothetical protein
MRLGRWILVVALGTSLLLVGPISGGASAEVNRLPDLVITGVLYNADCDAGTLYIKVTVENQGSVATGTFGVSLWFNEIRQPVRVIDGLAAGALVKPSWTVSYEGGDEFDREHADVRDRVRETTETNNSSSDVDLFCA